MDEPLETEGGVTTYGIKRNTINDNIGVLPDGTYTLQELEAPEGYVLAAPKQFVVKVEIVQIDAGSDASPTPCPNTLFGLCASP